MSRKSQISRTPPLGQRENHEKYSVEASAAMRYSYEATQIISAVATETIKAF
jgi:hypothetical protein